MRSTNGSRDQPSRASTPAGELEASEKSCSNQNLYYICSSVYTGVKNNFHVYKNKSAS